MDVEPIPKIISVNEDHFKVTSGDLDFSDNQETNVHVWQDSFLEQHDFTITEAGGTVTGNLEKEGGGDLTMYFSDEFTVLDTTPAATIDLTALVGTDTAPAEAFIYIPQSTKVLTAAASWPAASVEHIRVAHAILQSAATTGTDSALGNRNWNDFAFGITDPRGHGLHIAERLRAEHAKWRTGVVLTITGDGTGTVTLDVSAGTVYQLHLQAFPALDMAGVDDIHLVNLVGSEYSTTSNLVADITTLADGVTALANNKFFNIVIWGVQNRTGETSHLMCNLPTGQYNTALGGTTDSSKFSVHTIPVAFVGTGFLIAELTFKLTGGGTTWTLEQNKDLLGQTPTLVPGGGTTTAVSIFSDAQFAVFDNDDDTKRLALQLSSIDTGNIRTLTMADDDIDLDILDVAAPGTADASRVLLLDASKDITGINALTATTIGAFQATGAIDFNDQNMTNVDIDSGSLNGINSGATIGNLTLADGSITDSSGTISFGNEHLVTTGSLSSKSTNDNPGLTITGTVDQRTEFLVDGSPSSSLCRIMFNAPSGVGNIDFLWRGATELNLFGFRIIESTHQMLLRAWDQGDPTGGRQDIVAWTQVPNEDGGVAPGVWAGTNTYNGVSNFNGTVTVDATLRLLDDKGFQIGTGMDAILSWINASTVLQLVDDNEDTASFRIENFLTTTIGDVADDGDYLTINNSGDLSFVGAAGFYPRLVRQAAEPANGTGSTQIDDEEMMMWIDTDDSNRVYLMYNDNTNTNIVKVELT